MSTAEQSQNNVGKAEAKAVAKNYTINTRIQAMTVSLNALKSYRAGDHVQTISLLLQVLDSEPNDWLSRLMLAGCYYKTAQYAAAQRSFHHVYKHASDADLKRKALEGEQASNAHLRKSTVLPEEFGCCARRNASPDAF